MREEEKDKHIVGGVSGEKQYQINDLRFSRSRELHDENVAFSEEYCKVFLTDWFKYKI